LATVPCCSYALGDAMHGASHLAGNADVIGVRYKHGRCRLGDGFGMLRRPSSHVLSWCHIGTAIDPGLFWRFIKHMPAPRSVACTGCI
jgi:hypothetical protein